MTSIEWHREMDYALVEGNVMKREVYLKRWGVAWVSFKEPSNAA